MQQPTSNELEFFDANTIANACAHINDYFPASWQKVGETNLEYHFRIKGRHAMQFLSHLVMYRKS